MAIKINGQDLQKRIIEGQEVQKVMYNGSQIRPSSTPVYQGGIYYSSELGLLSYSLNGSLWYTMKDKDLGATTLGGQGNLYQRGNNYPFTLSNWDANISTTQVDASNYGPDNPYSSNVYIANGTYDSNWDSSNNVNLWGTGRNHKGPCPDGFHVPRYEDMMSVLEILRHYVGSDDLEDCKDYIFHYGTASTIYNHNSVPSIRTNSEMWTWLGDWGTYRPNQVITDFGIRVSGAYGSTNGLPIRPFKDVAVVPDNTWIVLVQ